MDREQEIRRIAYELWEDEGHPSGPTLEHLRRAEAIWVRADKPGTVAAQPELATIRTPVQGTPGRVGYPILDRYLRGLLR